MQGGLTWLWLDSPYVIAARKLFNWAVEANNKGEVFPVSQAGPSHAAGGLLPQEGTASRRRDAAIIQRSPVV